MTRTEARELIIDVLGGIAPEADIASLPGDVPLREELDLDSMDFLNFITAVHERAWIDIPEADYPRMATLDGAIEYLCR